MLQKEFTNTFIAQQFVDFERYNVFVKLLEEGTNRTPFKAGMLEPLKNLSAQPKRLVNRSRQRFTARRKDVESKLNRAVISNSGIKEL